MCGCDVVGPKVLSWSWPLGPDVAFITCDLAWDLGALPCVEPPIHREAADVVAGESVQGILGSPGGYLPAENSGDQEGTICCDRRRPSEHRTGKLRPEDDWDHAEGRPITYARRDKQQHEQPEEGGQVPSCV